VSDSDAGIATVATLLGGLASQVSTATSVLGQTVQAQSAAFALPANQTSYSTPGGPYTYTVPSFMVTGDLFDFIIYAGGAGGNAGIYGSGGGAGQRVTRALLVYGTDIPLSTTTFTVTVGAPGAGGTNNATAGGNSTVAITGYSGSPLTAAGGLVNGNSGSVNGAGVTPQVVTVDGQDYWGGQGGMYPGNPGQFPGGGGASGPFVVAGEPGGGGQVIIRARKASAVTLPGSGARVTRTSTANVNLSANATPAVMPANYWGNTAKATPDITVNLTNGSFTVANAGWYSVKFATLVGWGSQSGTYMQPVLFHNGNPALRGTPALTVSDYNGSLQYPPAMAGAFDIDLAAGDTVQAGRVTNDTNPFNGTGEATGTCSYFSIALINRSLA
jgi:hypothetical protein